MAALSLYPFSKFLSCLLITFALFSIANAVSFNITRFTPELTSILYRGDALPSAGAIQFNMIDYKALVGQAIYSDPIPIWDSHTGKIAHFSTHYTFQIDTRNNPRHGDGFAFFLAPVDFQVPPNSAGGFLGLFNTSNSDSPQNHIVAVEFDSYPNRNWDPNFEHVGISINTIASNTTAPWNATLHANDTADAWIFYNSSTKNLSVYWSYRLGPNSSLSYRVDLKEILPPWAIVGFSAATGNSVEYHKLYSWEFTSDLDIKITSTSGSKTRSIGLVVGLSTAGGIAIVVGWIIVMIVVKKQRKRSSKNGEMANLSESINDDLERGAGPKRFSHKDLASATNNFSKERKLGEGECGEVYKGEILDMNISVAVKKFSRGSKHGKKQYVTEVKTIGILRHRNLVQLIGWCHENDEFFLVYEYMPNGSLDSHLFGTKNPPLGWDLRYKIAMGLASALFYLHEECEQCVVHRDIKSSNIMLDSSFNVKLGDFGLARLMNHELGPQTTGLAGTLSYLAPEYISTGRTSKESDVYSFGIVALEIASGRKSVVEVSENEDSVLTLLKYVWDLYELGKFTSAVDERLNDNFDLKQVECLLTVGLWCAHPNPSMRPSIRQAIQVLNFESALPKLPSKTPVVRYHDAPTLIIPPSELLVTYGSLRDSGR